MPSARRRRRRAWTPALPNLSSRIGLRLAQSLPRFHDAAHFAGFELGSQFLAGTCGARGTDDLTTGVVQSDGVAAGQDLVRAEEAQARGQRVAALTPGLQLEAGLLAQAAVRLAQQIAAAEQGLTGTHPAQAQLKIAGGQPQFLQVAPNAAGEHGLQIIQALQALV